MNHEFSLKTELPVNQASPARSQAISDSQDRVESERYQAFSSELDKQIDKQVPQKVSQSKSSKQSGAIAKGPEQSDSVKSTHEAKAEIILDKNGNPLPTEKEIVQELTSQLLGDFEGDPATKKELTQIIEQFVHNIVNNETPDVDLKDSVTLLINQLLKAGLGADKAQVDPKPVLSSTDNVEVGFKSVVSGVGEAAKVIDPAVATAAQKQVVIEGDHRQNALKQDHAEGVKKKSVPTGLIKGDLETVGRVQSVIQQIKDIVTTEVSAKTDETGGKTQLVSSLVKQLLGLGSEGSVSKQAATAETVDKVTAVNVGETKLRSDILQALTSKTAAVTIDNKAVITKATTATANNDASISKATSVTANKDPLLTVTNSFLKGEISNASTDEKHIDRITQLVDLLKPAKSDEQLTRTTMSDKAAPAVSSPLIGTTPLAATSSVTKTDLPSLDIQPSLQSKAWNNVLSSRVIWMAREGIQQAALKLNPANLGPVEVRLNMHNEQANITFISQNAATRDALEQALPRLRESFFENGLELIDAEVSDSTSQQTKDDTGQNGEDINGEQSLAATQTNENVAPATTTEQDLELGLSVYA